MPGPSRQAAQPRLAAVLPLPRRAASTESAASGPAGGPVTRLPASPDGPGHAAPAEMPGHLPGDALSRITSDVLRAGRTLQEALDQPADALRHATEQVLRLFDGTIRDARAAAFAEPGHGAGDCAGAGQVVALERPGAAARFEARRVVGEDIARLSRLRALEAAQSRARSAQAHARALELAAQSAALIDRVAANFSQASVGLPHRAADLRALSDATAGYAARMRRWAHDHATAG